MAENATATQPLPGAEVPAPGGRLPIVDVLRGVALLGIVLVNAQYMSGVRGTAGTSWDRAAEAAVGFLAEMKFYPLFAFLFGYSLVLLMRRKQDAMRPALFGRRLLVLFVLGCAHAVLLFPGDILTTYAVLGAMLWALRRLRTRALVAVAVTALVAQCLLLAGLGAFTVLHPAEAGRASAAAGPVVTLYRGGPADTVTAHLTELPDAVAGSFLFALHVLAVMLLGMAAGRRRLLERASVRRLRRVAVAGLLVGVPGNAVMVMCAYGPAGPEWFFVGKAVGALAGPALTAAYVCLLMLLFHGDRHVRLRSLLATAGRLSLTHYLTQSLVLAVVFTGYGAGLYARMGPWAVAACAAGLYGCQLWAGDRLSRGHAHGPAEHLMRRITQGARQ
ncbi:DUF418 domain-containing protein [Streptomyces antibioticus]|uniref:DUF418 domain-containing protein n=1 Tax=Streptomyces antibioticus TaxID=1890 RepID=UPI0036DC746B